MKTSSTSPRLKALPPPEMTPRSFVASKRAWRMYSEAFAKLDSVSTALRLLNEQMRSASSPASPESQETPSTSSDTPSKPSPTSSPPRPRLTVISKRSPDGDPAA